MRKVLRWTLAAAALTGMLAGAGPASAACSGGGLCVTLLSSPVFYTDLTPPGTSLVINAEYIEFLITNNTGSPILNPVADLVMS